MWPSKVKMDHDGLALTGTPVKHCMAIVARPCYISAALKLTCIMCMEVGISWGLRLPPIVLHAEYMTSKYLSCSVYIVLGPMHSPQQ